MLILKTTHNTFVKSGITGADILEHGPDQSDVVYLVPATKLFSFGVLINSNNFERLIKIVEVKWLNSKNIALQDVESKHYLSAEPEKEVMLFNRPSPARWEIFEINTRDLRNDKRLRTFDENYLGDDLIETILNLSKQFDSPSARVGSLLIEQIDRKFLIENLARFRSDQTYKDLFSVIRRRLRGNEPNIAVTTKDLLKWEIERFGWEIGEHSYGAPKIFEPTLGKLRIGCYCSMNEFVVILGNHKTSNVTTFPFKALEQNWPSAQWCDDVKDHTSGDVEIGNDVWIGNGVIILPGSRVHDGAILGAHAVVRGEVPPYAIVVGNPGKVIRKRFSDTIIDRLLQISWWSWPDFKVDKHINMILSSDIDKFLRTVSDQDLAS